MSKYCNKIVELALRLLEGPDDKTFVVLIVVDFLAGKISKET
jgi:hypothetical protein